MNGRSRGRRPFHGHSPAIRREIRRFESVHPSIYAVYDLLELVPDPPLARRIREHVVGVEDSFVNSQEWTLSGSVPDIRLGIVGSPNSGKSALVHRYLTGSYVPDESPEGGRFKKEVVVDGRSYLLLVRDEGGPPEIQFCCWADATVLVFSLENEASFEAVRAYYAKMSHYRNPADLPVVLVGTQDAISESNPRIVDDGRARKLAADLRGCSYYETCATYGLNVDRVFQDACQKVVRSKMAGLTPNGSGPDARPVRCDAHAAGDRTPADPASSSPGRAGRDQNTLKDSTFRDRERSDKMEEVDNAVRENKPEKMVPASCGYKENLPTPCSTPTASRKTRRRSNLFPPLKKADDDKKLKNGEVGSGRVIPLRQGYLYKRSCKALNKEWKKKYVTLTNDGRLTYHPSLHDYMDDVHGKEIPLMHTTVKIPGQKPRSMRPQGATPSPSSQQVNELVSDVSSLSIAGGLHHQFPIPTFNKCKDNEKEALLASTFDLFRDIQCYRSSSSNGEDAIIVCNASATTGILNGSETQLIPAVPSTNPLLAKLDTPIVKKRHRRMKSTGIRNLEVMDDSDGYEFIVVSLDNKQWHFEASSNEDREAWISAIEQQILTSLQTNETSKSKSRLNSTVDVASIQTIRTAVSGNRYCVDCDAANPDWASLNIGALMCIECSGIHRNLGSHISRVRSLDLDEWPPEHVSVMMALGNSVTNGIWEGNTRGKAKPTPNSSREEKERWIRAKYEFKEFLAPLNSSIPISQQLIDAVCKSDAKTVALILAHTTNSEQVNAIISSRDQRTPLHLAASLGNLAITQLLIWYNGNVRATDSEGRTPLAHARNAGWQEVQDLLLHSGCSDALCHASSTVPRRRSSLSKKPVETFDKLPASII
ncbi:centaurin-gamma-1A-like isoform X1 [Centruroides sculpturatus]|uniref:centaurin-gamma-1A-like isoform X1 n=2 Tax=Centruroides sculpturatus TaxID=218467 RepID=UPI000C6ECB8F|nr:centaurin-gamma-1A-like isoform X1 [Centruroides sculpturatus]